jgi:LacI family transcriptional regulator
MRDVAAIAGVSVSTVSRVVNGSPVADDLAVKVQEAVALLGYRHNHTAGALRRADGASRTIGLVVEDVSNPFFSAIHRGVEETARTRGVVTFAGSSDEEPARERELIDALLARRVDGLIIAPTPTDRIQLLRDVASGLALVYVDRVPISIDADCVVSDNRGGAERAVTHLISYGHRRIAFLGDRPGVYTASERLAGYQAALARAEIPEARELICHPRPRAADAYELTRELLRSTDAPTAIFTSQNLITLEALRALHHLGLQTAVALVGFDDVPLAEAIDPPVTVVAQNAHGLGREAARLLFSRLDGYDGPGRRLVLDTPLITRGSGELPPP